jgi:catechol 2,3-dioxygenase-like lactoylglutathione lyase family enzyme
MNPLKQLSINGLQHVGIPVTSMEISEAFYSRLGFTKVMEAPFEHGGASGICVMMKREGIILELYQMPERTLEDVRRRKDGHIDHIAFDVSDIEGAYKLLQENGFQMVEPAPVFLNFWTHGCRYFNITGPNGERLEFNAILQKH